MTIEATFWALSFSPYRALNKGSSQRTNWTTYLPQWANPAASSDPNRPDGVIDMGEGGMMTAPRLWLMPYCEGDASAKFSMRVWGWRDISSPGGTDQTKVWIPYILAEFACVAGLATGPGAPSPLIPSIRIMLPTERTCDQIVLTMGILGKDGFINSPATPLTPPQFKVPQILANVPPSPFSGFILLDIQGSRKVSFDFNSGVNQAQQDELGMNCLWARA